MDKVLEWWRVLHLHGWKFMTSFGNPSPLGWVIGYVHGVSILKKFSNEGVQYVDVMVMFKKDVPQI